MKFHRVYIEITNICGLACSFCPPKELPSKTMELTLFESIVLQLKLYTNEIALHVMGDPMVLSNLTSYLDVLHAHEIKAMITTSGFYLDDVRRAALFHPCIRQVNISLNSFNKNQTHVTFEKYIEPIMQLCREKLESNFDFFLNMRLWNLDEICSENEFNQKIFDYFESHFGLESLVSQLGTGRQSIRLDSKILLHFDRYFQWPSLSNIIVGHGYCHGGSKQLGILADATVVPCCLDGEGVIGFGNLQFQTLQEIFESQRYKNLVDGFQNHLAHEELCQKCSYKERFNEL
jgi:radical SAM protein with 4Fe4S-binding SPASM domain